MTTFLNLMVVLIPFLLITAVFSRITIVELSLPTSAGGASSTVDHARVEVIVDRTTAPPRVLARRDLTALGFPIPGERGEDRP